MSSKNEKENGKVKGEPKRKPEVSVEDDGYIVLDTGERYKRKEKVVKTVRMGRRKKSGKYSRDKGKRFELQVSHMLKARGFEAKRGIQFRGGGEEQPDIMCELLDFIHFELKAVEKFNLNSAIKQAVSDRKRGQVPCVVHKRNRETVMASLPLIDLINIVQWALDRVDTKNTLDLEDKRENGTDKEKGL